MTAKAVLIRDALKTALTGLPGTGSNVFTAVKRPLTDAELPAITIQMGGEPDFDVRNARSGLPYGRVRSFYVSVIVKTSGDFESDAEAIRESIESTLLPAHLTLSGLAHQVSLASIADPEMDDSTDKPVYRLTVILRVIYSS